VEDLRPGDDGEGAEELGLDLEGDVEVLVVLAGDFERCGGK
jgi:hypothetical protein